MDNLIWESTTSIKTLAEGLGDFTARLDAYNVYLPKQARWQAELLLTDFTHDPQISGALSNLSVLSDSAAKASGNLEQMPGVVDQARKSLRRMLIRAVVRAGLSPGRVLRTLYALQQERIATMAAMHGERLATTEQISQERRAAMEALRGQEIAMMNEFEAMSKRTIQDLDTRGRGLINFFFLRALELVLLTLLVFSLLAWVILRRFVPEDRCR